MYIYIYTCININIYVKSSLAERLVSQVQGNAMT